MKNYQGVYILRLFLLLHYLLSLKASLIYIPHYCLSVFIYYFYAVFCFIVPRAILGNHKGTLFIIIKFINQLKVHYYKESPLFSDFNLALIAQI